MSFLLINDEGALLGEFNTKKQALEFQIEHRLQNSSTIIELSSFLKSLDEIEKQAVLSYIDKQGD